VTELLEAKTHTKINPPQTSKEVKEINSHEPFSHTEILNCIRRQLLQQETLERAAV
jgi:hypothetical protein